MRDGYMRSDPRFIAWQTGAQEAADTSHRPWLDLISEVTAAGVAVRRVRIISEPASDYIRWEHSLTDANVDAGEHVRWLPRRQASDLLLPGNDYWLFDDEVALFLHFDGDGELAPDDEEEVTDPGVVDSCAAAFEAAWVRGVAHADYHLL
ncbi:DUF6879 family protein [Streptomyces sp. NRRL F-5123]|uniref:DUF6879 family protein n=1 Tax=Streptomyces sp. NRRL F-5123 TaxID=1463856 RepID=UPI0006947CE3|nr:DUF6879 family protein [Streptomyces sp. NRRL F-5123]